jgi:hypothetical protein
MYRILEGATERGKMGRKGKKSGPERERERERPYQ